MVQMSALYPTGSRFPGRAGAAYSEQTVDLIH